MRAETQKPRVRQPTNIVALKALPGDPMVEALNAQAKAMLAQAAASTKVAQALETATERLGPAADALHSLADAQQKLCEFIVRNRLKLAASVPLVLTLIGAISPNAAAILADALRTWMPTLAH